MNVGLLCLLCCVGSGCWDGLVTRSEESIGCLCVFVCVCVCVCWCVCVCVCVFVSKSVKPQRGSGLGKF